MALLNPLAGRVAATHERKSSMPRPYSPLRFAAVDGIDHEGLEAVGEVGFRRSNAGRNGGHITEESVTLVRNTISDSLTFEPAAWQRGGSS